MLPVGPVLAVLAASAASFGAAFGTATLLMDEWAPAPLGPASPARVVGVTDLTPVAAIPPSPRPAATEAKKPAPRSADRFRPTARPPAAPHPAVTSAERKPATASTPESAASEAPPPAASAPAPTPTPTPQPVPQPAPRPAPAPAGSGSDDAGAFFDDGG